MSRVRVPSSTLRLGTLRARSRRSQRVRLQHFSIGRRRLRVPNPMAAIVVGAHAVTGSAPVQRIRSAVRPVGHVFESGAANGAVIAFGWRGAVVVPVVLVVSLVLAHLPIRRRLA